jgi:CspA family cold shock protein
MNSINAYPIITNGAERQKGTVKWFSERLGYGFIEVEGEEVFIHRTTLSQFGACRLLAEDIVTVTTTSSSRGKIVDTLFGIERLPVDKSLIASEPAEDEHIAYVKFFNEMRGYGFIEVEGYDQDIFVHSRIIEQNGLSTIYTKQKLLVTVVPGEKGFEIKTIRLLIDSEQQEAALDDLRDSLPEKYSASADEDKAEDES